MAAMPTRSPVNDPGPAMTAKRSTSAIDLPWRASQSVTSCGSRSPCVRVGSPVVVSHTSPSIRATLPARVTVSSASTSMAQCYTPTGSTRSVRVDAIVPPVTSSSSSSSAHAQSSASATPAMRQYLDAKRQHRDAIVFFRMGDFYEMFYEDALVAARALDLTLTSRSKDAGGNGIPMCGVPYHAVDGYLARLVRKGFRVAICEQVEDPRKAKGLVKREVVRVVSPGTLTDSTYLEAREPAFLMAIATSGAKDEVFGAALIDLSTGEFSVAEYQGAAGLEALADEVAVLRP